ncbi:MAG: S-layer homology domain-containing protein [Oscillospiraceae bacterium]|nr:S-layer homology domain-containing protein [Oscillospiraceae bacterium]
MKRNLRKLLSAVCCLAMLMTMLPITASAADEVFFQDDFSKYTVGAFDAAANGYKYTKASGTPDVTIEAEGGNQYLKIAAQRPWMEMGSPTGTYTMQFDVRRDKASSGLMELWMGTQPNGQTIRMRLHENGAVAFLDTATSKNYFLLNDGGFSNGGYNDNRKDEANAILAANTWYHVEFIADAGANTIKLTVSEVGGTASYQAERTMPDFDNHTLRIDGQDFSGSTIAVSLDNIKVVSGAVEATLPEAPKQEEGEAISGGALGNFADAAEITYDKAVEVTAGLGLFAGTDGKFLPKGTVTRAQMATIVVKMLYGSDLNADSFKGAGKFSDTAGFEGGWAEGYINLCSTLGVVSGYGDGTFKPGNQVTTAEAATMILNALKVDAGEGTWPHTVMAKAEELDLFDELSPKPANNKALTREELAVMALAGLEYSPEGITGYEYDGKIYDSFMEAMLIAGDASKVTPASKDTLATTVFELKTVEGYITGNQATGLEYTELNGAGPFAIETGLEHIGHWVTVYYAEDYVSEDEPGVTYTIYDETKVFEVKDEDIDTAKEYKALFGKSYRLAADGIAMFDGEYVMAEDLADEITGYNAGSYAPMGTYFVCEGKIVAYMEPVEEYASQVTNIITTSGKKSIALRSVAGSLSNEEEDDQVVEYKGIAREDYVTYRVVQGVYYLEKADKVTGKVTRSAVDELGRTVITMSGKKYVDFGTNNNTGLETADVDFDDTIDLYVTADGKFIGFETSGTGLNIKDVAYILGSISIESKDNYGKTITNHYARGVNMDGKEVLVLLAVDEAGTVYGTIPGAGEITEGYYTVADAKGDRELTKREIKTVEAFGEFADFDPEEDEAFWMQIAATTTSFTRTGYRTMTDINGAEKRVYFSGTASSRYIFLEGDANSAVELKTQVTVGKAGFSFDAGNAFMLLAPSGDGTYGVQAMVIPTELNNVAGGSLFYVTADNAAPAGMDSEGYTYKMYNADDGSLKEIAVNNEGETLEPGFYSAVFEDGAYELTARVPQVDSKFDDNVSQYSVSYDQLLYAYVDGMFSSSSYNVWNVDAKSAKIVDTRDEKVIDKSIIPEITSLDQIITMWDTNPEYEVYLDVCVDDSADLSANWKVKTIFISGVFSKVDTVLDQDDIADLPDTAVVRDMRTSFLACERITTVDQLKEAAADPDLIITASYSGPDAEDMLVVIENIVTPVLRQDDFEDYDVGNFYNGSDKAALAVEKGYSFTKVSGAPAVDIVAEGSNQILQFTAARPYIMIGDAGAAYTLTYDLRRDAEKTGLFEVHIGSSANYRLDVYENGAVSIKDGSKNYYVRTDGTLLPNNSGNVWQSNREDAETVKLAQDTWYTIELTVYADTTDVNLKIVERETGTVLVDYLKVLPAAISSMNIRLDAQSFGGSDPAISIDNLDYRLILD